MKYFHKPLFIGSICYTLFMMLIYPDGSFNPLEWNFYAMLIPGIMWYFLMYMIFRKNFKKA
ncbi:MAG: hypothetical protein AAF696_00545 [Bacteroidota bacterium]